MKAAILSILLPLVPFCSVTGQESESVAAEIANFAAKDTLKFSTKGHEKSKGIALSVRYPKSWKAEEDERPNIVKKFISPSKTQMVLIVTNPLEFPPETTDAEISEMFSVKDLVDSLPKDEKVISASMTKIDGEKAGLLEYTNTIERQGVFVHTHCMNLVMLQEEQWCKSNAS